MPRFEDDKQNRRDEGDRDTRTDSGKTTLQDIIHRGLSRQSPVTDDAVLMAACILSLNKTLTRLLDTLEAIGGEEVTQARQRQQNMRKAARSARQDEPPRESGNPA